MDVAGRPLTCPHCEGPDFDADEIMLTGMMPPRMMDLYVCRACGHVLWFAQ